MRLSTPLVLTFTDYDGRPRAEVLTFRDGLVCRGFGSYGT
jgi:hypothetical protein